MWELLAHTYGTTRQVFHKSQYYKRSILEFLNWILAWTLCISNWEKRENFKYALFCLFLSSPSFYHLLTLEKKKLWKYKEPSYKETVALVFKGSDWNTHCGCQSPLTPANVRLSISSSWCFCFCMCQPSLTQPGACGPQISNISEQLGDLPQIQAPSP